MDSLGNRPRNGGAPKNDLQDAPLPRRTPLVVLVGTFILLANFAVIVTALAAG